MIDTGPSSKYLELAASTRADLVGVMRRGDRPDPGALEGWEYRGLNTARWARRAGADRFVKGFVGGRGYNRRIRRGSRTGPWLPSDQPEPEPFAFFSVEPVDPESRENRYLNALLFDYSAYASGPLDPAGGIRDYAVTLDDAHDLLLGHAFVALGRARLHATFFVLERLRRAPANAASASTETTRAPLLE